MGINIHPAGEWLLDNYYIIEETVKMICKELTIKKYKNFVSLASGPYKGFARIYVVASEIVAYTEGRIDSHNLKNLLAAYQRKKTLNMEEIWNIGTFLQIAIIETIRNVCEKIYSVQMQKYKVESIIERLVEFKTREELKFDLKNNYKHKIMEKSYEMKYPFIEYMSYRLKRYGKKTYPYLETLETEVMKMGTSVSEVIKKEHFDIAVRKVIIGNCIKSIKEIGRINFLEIFESINGVEEVLRCDPSEVYEKMDYKTKAQYRNKIKEISKRTKISEIYITKKALELAKKEGNRESKKAHIGYYLIDKGEEDLYKELQTNKKSHLPKQNVKAYILAIIVLSIACSIGIAMCIQNSINIGLAILVGILVFIPMTQLVTGIIQFTLSKFVKPTLIPKMDYAYGVPEDKATMVIIPTIIGSKEKVKDLLKKLEVFYLANKSDNIYFTLLGDVKPSTKQEEPYDKEIVEEGKRQVEILNKKYPSKTMGKFQFIYVKRIWNSKQKCYLGWERKRGMICSLNKFLCEKTTGLFRINTMEQEENIPKIKYIITLDADTNLVLNSGLELIGAAAHILNKPELNEKNDAVILGHALIQPRVGIDLVSARKSLFTKIYAGAGGVDSYTNAISDTYQDNFDEGIFTGKGIYDLEVFHTIFKNEIPDNTVLSHDLLEGCYLRCALSSDILLLDGYPYKYNAYISRLSRWIRGDWQITRWLKRKIITRDESEKENPLGILSKFKILDNLRRSLVEIMVGLSLGVLLALKLTLNIKIWPLVTLLLAIVILPTILELLCYIFNKEATNAQHKYFVKTISTLKASLLRGILDIGFLPHKAYISLNAIIKTIYRMNVSHENLLEWTTSEEAERNGKTDIFSYYKLMIVNVIVGVAVSILMLQAKLGIEAILVYALCIWWVLTPLVSWYISKEKIPVAKVKELRDEEIEYIIQIGKKTWDYFETYMNKENNFLPPDNYQEDRAKKTVPRTSSTNIGLGLITIVSAYDLGYIGLNEAVTKIENTVTTIEKLTKWNGHLYNWYNTKTLEPLIPKYISTVDSGNFVGYLYLLKSFLENIISVGASFAGNTRKT